MRRKGELSAAAIDREWPHQVVLPARLCERGGYNEIHEFCRDLTLCTRGHSLYHDDQWFHVYCFKEAADAHRFRERFGGERFLGELNRRVINNLNAVSPPSRP
jgi:hypothetical protein